MQKRGQITVYMILGLVIILSIISIFIFRDYLFKSSLQREMEKYSSVPEQVKPVKEVLDSCLYDVSYEAVKRAGLQGGYVYVPNDGLPVLPSQPFSNRIRLNSGQEIPYWYYETSNGIQRSQLPTVEQIQDDISKFINENIKLCITNLNIFTNNGYEFNINNIPQSDVVIEDESIIVKLQLPVKISLKDFNFNLDNHFAQVNVPLGRLYNTAKIIQEKENKENYFEEKTFDILVAYDKIPLSGTDISCAQKFWSVYEVTNKLKELISLNMRAIRVTNQKLSDGDYYNFDIGKDLNTMFLYSPDWPIKVDIGPSEGGVLKSDLISNQFSEVTGGLGSLLCINNYHFIYNIKYPLLISLIDDKSDNGNGYIFQFANMVIIKNNQPKENKLGTLEMPDLKFPLCENPTTNMTIFTMESTDNGGVVPLNDVKVSFKCLTTKCEMGVTEEDIFKESVITKTFPFCMNGLIIGEKEGYYKSEQFITTDSEKYVALVLDKLIEKNVDVKLIEKSTGYVREPYESEMVIFELKNKDNDYSVSFISPNITSIKLIPGTYEVKSYIIGTSTWPITLKGGQIEKCVESKIPTILGIFRTEKKCFPITIEDLKLAEVLKGGAEFEWEVSYDTLNKDSITFYTMVDKLPQNQEQLNLIYSSIGQNAKNPNFRNPG